MKYEACTVEDYIAALPDSRRVAFLKILQTIKENLPEGFEETLYCGMPSYVVPHSIYSKGYHCNPGDPLPFISLGNQKNYIGLYHMGIYAFPEVKDWFAEEYHRLNIGKLDMGKSCIRLKKMDLIPYALIADLCRKITVEDWVTAYESR